MKSILKKIFTNMFSIIIISYLISSLEITGGFYGLIISAVLLTILLDLILPLINLIMMPLNLITFNLTRWITLFLFVYLWSFLNPYVKIKAWNFSGLKLGFISLNSVNLVYWQTVIVISLFLTLLIKIIKWLYRYE